MAILLARSAKNRVLLETCFAVFFKTPKFFSDKEIGLSLGISIFFETLYIHEA